MGVSVLLKARINRVECDVYLFFVLGCIIDFRGDLYEIVGEVCRCYVSRIKWG